MEVQQKAEMDKIANDARHLQELSARKALEDKMANVRPNLTRGYTQCLSFRRLPH